ncbi:MAG: hypothetical protein RMJ97_02410 [Raineya sp.]|nr:hypothetical protein [Raineya sp.]
MKLRFLLLVLTKIFILPVLAQKVPSLKQDSIKLLKEQKKIIIPYRLNDNSDFKYEYDIKVFASQDSGKTYKQLEKIKGHYGKDLLAGEKQIWWFYEEENPDFDGLNLKIKVKADYKPSVFNLMNANAMKYSALLPGLGQNKVKYPGAWKNRWILTSVAVYGLIGGSIWLNIKAHETYDKYLEAQTRNEAQSLFSEAKRQELLSYGMAFASAVVWATDIVLVGTRGTKNAIEKKRILKHNQEKDAEIGIGINQTFFPQLHFQLKF